MELVDLLSYAVQSGASDLHLVAGVPPVLRINGDIIVTDRQPLTAAVIADMMTRDLTEENRAKFAATRQLCHSLQIPDVGYFRVSVYWERGRMGASVRVGMTEVRLLEELGLPAVCSELARKPTGLILITGPTGSGKTTTLNAMVDLINRERRCKIITVEDPIEYLHANKRSIVIQQEVYTDTPSFGEALVHILRQDPDVIGIGEMRDVETMATALTAAETGHLVISTLHTPDASQTINRVVDVFPSAQQNQVRYQLAASLEAVIAQKLLPRIDREGRVLATEMLVATPAVRNIIRENKISSLSSAIQTGGAAGMKTMDHCVRDLYQLGIITYDTALTNVAYPENLRGGPAVAPPVAGSEPPEPVTAEGGRR